MNSHLSTTDDELDFDADRRYELLCQAKTVADSLHCFGEQDHKLLKEVHDTLRELSVAVLSDLKRKKDRKW
jgi:hypothetical protein